MKNFLKDEAVRKQIFTIVFSGILLIIAYLTLNNLESINDFIGKTFSVLASFIWGIVFAILMSSMAKWMEKNLPHSIPFRYRRLISSIVAILTLILIILVMLMLIVPSVVESVVSLSNNISNFIKNNGDAWAKSVSESMNISAGTMDKYSDQFVSIISSFWSLAETHLPNIINAAKTTVVTISDFIIGFIVALYILKDRDKLKSTFKRLFRAILPQKSYESGYRIVKLSLQKFSQFFTGKIVDSIIVGVICFAVMQIFGWEYPILISVIIGVTNIVPFFGPFIGAIPAVLILLIVHPIQALYMLIFIIILQQIDGNIIGPRILGESVGLSSLWIMFAIIVGGGFFGFIGMLLGVPIFAVIYFLVEEFVDEKLDNEKENEKEIEKGAV